MHIKSFKKVMWIGLGLALAFWGTVTYVALHFIAKVW